MNMQSDPSIWIAVPAQNCAHSIEELIERINALKLGVSIVIVDDFSNDDTAERANKYDNVLVHRNKKILGYGGTTTKLYQLASENGADYVINVHGDLGHRPEDIVPIINTLKANKAGIVVGSRLVYLKNQIRDHGLKLLFKPELRGNMSLIRLCGHFGLTFVQNLLFNQKLHSYHEGMRGCNKQTLSWILEQDMPDWYDYDATLLVLAAANNISIQEIPSPPHYNDEAKSSAPPFKYGFRVLKNSLKSCRSLRQIARQAKK